MYAMLRKSMKDERGFTLIELVVVLAILGLLIAIALPSYYQARQTAARDEARVFGQEWRTLDWVCYLSAGVTGTCNSDSAIGFSETNAVNWNFATSTNAYTFATGTVTRCALANAGTIVAGQKYDIVLTISGTGAGTAYDIFQTGATCP